MSAFDLLLNEFKACLGLYLKLCVCEQRRAIATRAMNAITRYNEASKQMKGRF